MRKDWLEEERLAPVGDGNQERLDMKNFRGRWILSHLSCLDLRLGHQAQDANGKMSKFVFPPYTHME